jgi:hypothetical protein
MGCVKGDPSTPGQAIAAVYDDKLAGWIPGSFDPTTDAAESLERRPGARHGPGVRGL